MPAARAAALSASPPSLSPPPISQAALGLLALCLPVAYASAYALTRAWHGGEWKSSGGVVKPVPTRHLVVATGGWNACAWLIGGGISIAVGVVAPLVISGMGAAFLTSMAILHAKWRHGAYSFVEAPPSGGAYPSLAAALGGAAKPETTGTTNEAVDVEAATSTADVVVTTPDSRKASCVSSMGDLNLAGGGGRQTFGGHSRFELAKARRSTLVLATRAAPLHVRDAAIGCAALLVEILLIGVLVSHGPESLRLEPEWAGWSIAYGLASATLAPSFVLSFSAPSIQTCRLHEPWSSCCRPPDERVFAVTTAGE